MPAMVTHYMFGKSLLADFVDLGRSTEETCAFLLGNQGPDVFFYSFMHPSTASHAKLGSVIHDMDPAGLFLQWNRAVRSLSGEEQRVVAAYAAGFACHYLLDANAHPMVDCYQAMICESGEYGFGPGDKSAAHAAIEREIDEMMLYRETGRTVADGNPTVAMLDLGDTGLGWIGSSIVPVIEGALGVRLSPRFFPRSVKNFRAAWKILGNPRSGCGKLLASGPSSSFVRSMVLQPNATGATRFANEDHGAWYDAVTGAERHESLFDIMDATRAEAREWVPRILSAQDISLSDAQAMTRGRDFSGVLSYRTRPEAK